MEDIRFHGKLNFEIQKAGFIQVVRDLNHFFSCKDGKPFYSFVFVKKGALEYHFSPLKTHICVEQGHGIFIPKNLPYHVTYLQNSTKIKMLTFEIRTNTHFMKFNAPTVIKSPEQTLLFDSIAKQNMYSTFFLYSKIYELLHYLENTDNSIPQKYKKLLPALSDLKQQYFKNEKISYYAKLCSMSESNFRKLFKEYTANSPIAYRNLIRISAVQALLNTGECTISEAAYLVGFNNMSFFYQVYNKYKSIHQS